LFLFSYFFFLNDDGASAVVRCYFLQTATRFVTPFVGWNM